MGVLLYELLTGYCPFNENGKITGALQIYESILKNKIDIPTKVREREREGMCENVCEKEGE